MLGFAGRGFQLDRQVLLKPGEQTTLGAFTVRNDGIKVSDDGQKQMVTGDMAIFKGGQQIDTMYPARWFYRKHENEPTTEVAIRRGFSGDLYLTLAVNPKDVSTQNASLELFVNPLVDWIWVGFGLMALGTGIALLPETTYSFALARVPGDVATTTIALFCVLLLSGTTLFAQQPDVPLDRPIMPRTPVEKQLHADINCTCGGCFGPLKDCPMMYCQTRQEEKSEIRDLIDQGKTHDEIIQAFVKRYGGQQVLNAPIDRGFNRLAWLVPYVLGVGGIVIVGFVATRWSRPHDEPPPDVPADAGLNDRLDDELRNLD
jgi:cytochrome c-type biogenesis protein CcmF